MERLIPVSSYRAQKGTSKTSTSSPTSEEARRREETSIAGVSFSASSEGILGRPPGDKHLGACEYSGYVSAREIILILK